MFNTTQMIMNGRKIKKNKKKKIYFKKNNNNYSNSNNKNPDHKINWINLDSNKVSHNKTKYSNKTKRNYNSNNYYKINNQNNNLLIKN